MLIWCTSSSRSPRKQDAEPFLITAALYELLAGLGIPGIFDRVTMCAQQSRVCTQRATDRAEDSKRRPQLLTTVAGSADVDAWWKIGRGRTHQSFNLTKQNASLCFASYLQKNFRPVRGVKPQQKKKSKRKQDIFTLVETNAVTHFFLLAQFWNNLSCCR